MNSLSERKQLEHEEAELEQLRFQLYALTREVDTWREKQKELEQLEIKLCELLVIEAGIDCSIDTFEIALTKFNQGVNNHKRWDNARTAYEAAIKHQQSLPDIQATMKLKASLAELEATIDRMQREHPTWFELKPDQTPQAYAMAINQADEERANKHAEYLQLKNETEQTINHLRHPAELDEEINEARATVQQLEEFRDALELAHRELAGASQDFQKQFAPRLERLMDESLSQISQGRYSAVRVDPNSLTVLLTAPEHGNMISVDRLSTGTRDLVYLTLRVGIAQAHEPDWRKITSIT